MLSRAITKPEKSTQSTTVSPAAGCAAAALGMTAAKVAKSWRMDSDTRKTTRKNAGNADAVKPTNQ